jgi:competence protein ComEC
VLAEAPLLPVAAAFAVGILAAQWVPGWSLWALAAAAVLIAAGAMCLRWCRERITAALLLAAVATLGFVRASPDPLPPDHVSRLALPGTFTLEAVLASEPLRWAPDRARLVLEVGGVAEGDSVRPAAGRVQLAIYGSLPALAEGQRIAVPARLHPPTGLSNPGSFDYPAHLAREGIVVVGSARAEHIIPLTPEAPPWPARVKRWAVATLGQGLPDTSAALLAGLLLGERTALPREVDEAFRRAGVYHILAVSGFNVALLASSTFFTLSLLHAPRRLAAVVAGGLVVAFALVVGPEPSVLRATIMATVLLAAVLLDRESRLMNALAGSALVLLAWRPGDLQDPGFQLSFAATAGIIHLAPAMTEAMAARGAPRWLAAPAAVSLAAQGAVTPVMLAHFNQLSLVAVGANLLVVPLAGAATALGLLALLVALTIPVASSLLFNALWALLLLLRAAVRLSASLPLALLHLPAPAIAATGAWCTALALVPAAVTSRRLRVAAIVLLATALGLGLWPWVRPGPGRLRVIFFDVGQGDATLVELPDGRRLLLDGGAAGERRLDMGERVVAPFLWDAAVTRLDVVAMSHSDPDHSGGLATVIRNFRVDEFWDNGRWGPGSEDTLRALCRAGVRRRALSAGSRIWLGEALVTVLAPGAELAAAASATSDNELSLVLRLDWRGLSLLLPGDLGARGEERLLAGQAPLAATLLKVGHHGSRFGTTDRFLEATRPWLAVISAGPGNPFGHPATQTLARLAAARARVYRTDRDGAILMESDGVRLWITRWGTRTTETFSLDPESARPHRGPDGAEPDLSLPAAA